MATIEARGYVSNSVVKTSKGGKSYRTFTLGVKQKERAWGDKPETVTWGNYNVTDFASDEVIQDKSYVTVKGFLTVRQFEDKQGMKRQSLDVRATEIEVAEPLPGQAGPKPKAAAKEPWDDDAAVPF